MRKPLALIAYDQEAASGEADDLDVFEQISLVRGNLEKIGYKTAELPVGLNLQQLCGRLQKLKPDLIFNLVESLQRKGSLIHFAPALFETLRLRFTGSGSDAIYLTSNKLLAKMIFQSAGILTPRFYDLTENCWQHFQPDSLYLCKYVWEHASRGLNEQTIFYGHQLQKIKQLVQRRAAENSKSFFEEYIEGREFNVSLLAGKILNIAEIRFINFAPDEPKIVDYEAKWVENSRKYQQTVRSFEFSAADKKLLGNLRQTCLKIWNLFGLRGYARIDCRVDQNEQIWVLEVNANPCLSPDAGFMAAARRAGLDDFTVIERIIKDC